MFPAPTLRSLLFGLFLFPPPVPNELRYLCRLCFPPRPLFQNPPPPCCIDVSLSVPLFLFLSLPVTLSPSFVPLSALFTSFLSSPPVMSKGQRVSSLLLCCQCECLLPWYLLALAFGCCPNEPAAQHCNSWWREKKKTEARGKKMTSYTNNSTQKIPRPSINIKIKIWKCVGFGTRISVQHLVIWIIHAEKSCWCESHYDMKCLDNFQRDKITERCSWTKSVPFLQTVDLHCKSLWAHCNSNNSTNTFLQV